MATNQSKTSKASASTAVVAWDEELSKYATEAAEAEAATGGGQYFSTRGGVLSFNDAAMPHNRMAVIIVDSVFENVFYEGRYNPEVIQAPTCFAFAGKEEELKPHDVVVQHGSAQHEQCRGCVHNEWGSSDTGSGKACRNTRRLILLPAAELDDQGQVKQLATAEDVQQATAGILKLPVTSVKGYAQFVKSVAGALKRPPFGIVSLVSVVPDPKTQFRVQFKPLMPLPDELIAAVMGRRDELRPQLMTPYSLDLGDAASEPAPRGRAAAGRGRAAAPASAAKGRAAQAPASARRF